MIVWLSTLRDLHITLPHPAAKANEWMLDNEFHLRRAIRQVQDDMPRSFYRRLPPLTGEKQGNAPRVLGLAYEMLEAAHMQVELSATIDFIRKSPNGSSLTIAELWAFPAMLRLACLEIVALSFAELAPEKPAPFGPSPIMPAMSDMEPTERVSRGISALISISTTSWKVFFESVSTVELILRDDPAGVYGAMDFSTRDSYRRVIEELADGAGAKEDMVAMTVLDRARAHASDPRRGHVGCWLVAEGRAEIEEAIGYRPSRQARVQRLVLGSPGQFYGSCMGLFFALSLLAPGLILANLHASWPMWLLGFIVSLIPASILSVMITQFIVTHIVPTRTLPKMDVDAGLPDDCPVVLVMPVILRRAKEVGPLVEKLEMHWLSNPEPMIRIIVLSDFADADRETMPDDIAIEQALVDGIRQLNMRYPLTVPFGLIHRARRFNPAESRWMGWERKRGKLEAFIGELSGHPASDFKLREGSAKTLSTARYAVTMDADTVGPPGAVNRLVGTFLHPLNAARFRNGQGKPLHGFTFLQPRVEISPAAGDRSWFTRLFTGDTSIDIYSRAVSDVYQDLFGEGVFIGKGIIDIAAFQKSLAGVVPENSLVSHDLFEGLHGGVALVSDVVFYEDFPPNYLAFSLRALRWMRGDWQLLPWLMPRVPSRSAGMVPNPLSGLDRLKIFDNLRRSLIAPGLVAFAVTGWIALPGSTILWTFMTIAAPGAYLFTELVTGLALGRRRGSTRSALRSFLDHAGRWLLAVIFMAHDAAISVRSIVTTVWRLGITRRNLLQWTSAAHVATDIGKADRALWREMISAPILAVTVGLVLAIIDPYGLLGALPLLALWLFSPAIAAFIGRPRPHFTEQLDADDRLYLRKVARKTWFFFETFAGAEDHWLPPDNYQGQPHAEIAHRTSPTNVGMLMVSTLAAHDFGHIGLRDLAARMTALSDTLDQLETCKGHMLNWIDTRTLKSLEPRYVSAVDSGNLAVSLLALKQGCLDAVDMPAIGVRAWAGLADVVGLLSEAAGNLPPQWVLPVEAALTRMLSATATLEANPREWAEQLHALRAGPWRQVQSLLSEVIAATPGFNATPLNIWIERTGHHLASMERDLLALFPWQNLLQSAPVDIGEMDGLVQSLPNGSTALSAIKGALALARERLADLRPVDHQAIEWQDAMGKALNASWNEVGLLIGQLNNLALRADARAYGMEFGFLYDPGTRTFFIGYNLGSDRLDHHHYDLLASEARLTSYFSIAKRDVPVEHWFHLGRPITEIAGSLSILSWNGSMFEYLMPALLLPSEPGRLLGQSERIAVVAQRQYGAKLNQPWGVSESGFAARDVSNHYQYQAFGIPELGLKRDLSANYVVSPYASALSLAVAPKEATDNLRRIDRLGFSNVYGFLEAIDYTPDRCPKDQSFVAVNAHMAHHQGMIITAIANALMNNVMVRRFLSEPRMRAIELLLQERVPWEFTPEILPETKNETLSLEHYPVAPLHGWRPDETFGEQLHMLGNGNLASWITSRGSGSLRLGDTSLTRWAGDALDRTGDGRLYVHDADNDDVWTFGANANGHVRELVFHGHKAEIHEHSDGVTISMEITVAAGENVEIRRLTISNDSNRVRHLQLTSYAEIVLAPPLSHERHPAFSKLFVHSERDEATGSLLFVRKPRRPEDHPPVLLHRLMSWSENVIQDGFETDRQAFLGRQGNSVRPIGSCAPLGGKSGWTLDAIMALRARVTLEPGAKADLVFITLAAETPSLALEAAGRFASPAALDWVFADSMHATALSAHRIGLTSNVLADAQALCHTVAHAHAAPSPNAILNRQDFFAQSALWRLGLSGDWPMILIRSNQAVEATLLAELVRVHHWWKVRGLRTDIVVLSDSAASYQEPVRDKLLLAMSEAGLPDGLGLPGGFHFLNRDQVSDSDMIMLESLARVIVNGAAAGLRDAVDLALPVWDRAPRFVPVSVPPLLPATPPADVPERLFSNGIGGFAADNHDYLIATTAGETTPSVWSNVLGNDMFGTIVTEAGLGFTWSVNSGEHRLTPWSNDPLLDPQGEALYLRDEESANVWTTTPLPAGGGKPCIVRHGAGISTWTSSSEGLEQTLSVFVPPDAPVKIVLLSLRNLTEMDRRITATYYAEWLLGAMASISRPHVVCDYARDHNALLARNGWNAEFASKVAFLTSSRPPHSLTADRTSFLGPVADPTHPAGLAAWSLDGNVTRSADPCAVYQVHVDIRPGATQDLVFVLGEGDNVDEALALARHWAHVGRARDALAANEALWRARLAVVTVETPDPAFDILVNRWLLQQVLASRVQARAGFHQAGGAYGFRDQLQDMLALLMIEPQRVRAHLLSCASRQFEEGDVLHWWHPPAGRGIRTRCSDDLLWLVYATGRYVEATGDFAILEETVSFLSAPPLHADEDDRYALFGPGQESGTLLEHCRRAMEHASGVGIHGLPLMGSGDWNDGMDRVGDEGRGESVWLGWFMAICADQFSNLARRMGLTDLADEWTEKAETLRLTIDREAWDGAWYLRAFDDNHQPLGSHENTECQIDSIAQSFGALAKGSEPARLAQALASARAHLVDRQHRIVRLLAPPFDRSGQNPGYIQSYPPGVRENGGQYSHAAAWLGLAHTAMGLGDDAHAIFDLVNPIRSAREHAGATRYRGEPYVIAGDVLSTGDKIGQAGWTWYTGAAGWMWQLAIHGIFGIRPRQGGITLAPCLPSYWQQAKATIAGSSGTLEILLERRSEPAGGQDAILVDGTMIEGNSIDFPGAGKVCNVVVRIMSEPTEPG
ncbi:GH36-type glycosyl hydrolase domain-containing protein [Rhizobium alvei]|uniref:Glucoamylase family protein n=1 Tax=Rhizobium alvei TaxID=1132659 RepID=A0ABT8YP56_9HYPH|nr:glucoamylase family protein [Rhizobium alvei]MDO6965464.1 glucoamylase family protein [Rhizobium alvei]